VTCCADCDVLMDADSYMSWQRDVPVKLRMADSGPLSEKPVSVMTALRSTAENFPDHPALGEWIILFCVLAPTHFTAS